LSGSSSPIAAALECRTCAPLAVTRKAAAGLGWWPGLAAGWGVAAARRVDGDLVRAAERLTSLPGGGSGLDLAFCLAWISPGVWAPMTARQAQVVIADCLTRYTEGHSVDHRRYFGGRFGITRGRWLLVRAGAVGLTRPGEPGDGWKGRPY